MDGMWRKRRKSVGQTRYDDEGPDGAGAGNTGDGRLPLPTTDSSTSSNNSIRSDSGGFLGRLWSGGWRAGEDSVRGLGVAYEDQRAHHYGYAEDSARNGGGRGRKGVLLPRERHGRRRRYGSACIGSQSLRVLLLGVFALGSIAYYLLGVFFIPQYSLKFDKRAWVNTNFSHLTPPPPLAPQCFDQSRIERETTYNWTEAQVMPRRRMVNAGTGMNADMGCYDAAKLVQPIDPVLGYPYQTSGWIPGITPLDRHAAKQLLQRDLAYDDRHIPPQDRILNYHTYWRTDLLPFSDRQASTLRAFLATQPLSTSRLIIWSNSAASLATAPPLAHLVTAFPDNIQIRQVDFRQLTRGTALEGHAVVDERSGGLYDGKGWIDGDAVRLLVLWNYGGVWVDMDQVLSRNLRPLVEHEFLSQWDCEDKPYLRFNGALMHFRRHSPYLCEAFHIMSTLPAPRPNSLNWGAHLYHHLHRRLLHGSQTPFAILPWCFTDPQNCRRDIAIPSPFTRDPSTWRGRKWDDGGREELEERIGSVFSVHLHNQWTRSIPEDGWLDRLVAQQAEKVRVLELYQRWDGR